MSNVRNWLGKASTVALAASVWSVGHAQTGQLDITGPNSYTPWTYAAGEVEGSYGGPFTGSYTPNNLPPVDFSMYCLSVVEGFYYGDPFSVDATLQTTQAGWLVDNASLLASSNGTYDSTHGLSDSATAETDALQLAIWAVTPNSNGSIGPYDAGLSEIATTEAGVGGSAFPVTSQDYVNDIALLGSKTGTAYYFTVPGATYGSDTGQPQIAPWTPNPGNPFDVPGAAPGPAAAIPFALGLIGVFRRRKPARA